MRRKTQKRTSLGAHGGIDLVEALASGSTVRRGSRIGPLPTLNPRGRKGGLGGAALQWVPLNHATKKRCNEKEVPVHSQSQAWAEEPTGFLPLVLNNSLKKLFRNKANTRWDRTREWSQVSHPLKRVSSLVINK